MASSILKVPALLLPSSTFAIPSLKTPTTLLSFSTKQTLFKPLQLQLHLSCLPTKQSPFFPPFVPFSASGDTTETEEAEQVASEEDSDEDAALKNIANDGDVVDSEESASSVVMASLQSYKQALANEDQSTIAEIEAFLQSIDDEKNSLASEVAILSAELLTERERVLRISADFDNFRKRTERERLSLMTNVQGEVVESLLPVLDNFERAKTQIKVEMEGEEKINNSYQSIYKQFSEILTALGVEAVENVGTPFDPLLHEAIMREDSTEYEEGIILQEFRKGFKLGERLLRPAMVKVSAGPGPAKSEEDSAVVPTADSNEESGETVEESAEEESADSA